MKVLIQLDNAFYRTGLFLNSRFGDIKTIGGSQFLLVENFFRDVQQVCPGI